jgi:fatty-acyl-CoA synthase
VELVKEGFNPSALSDPLFFLDPVDGQYVPLKKELFDRIVAGEIRL